MVESTKTGSDEFGEAVRLARERLGMSRRDLAATTGLSYPYISQIETGYRMPSTSAMRSLADALALRPDSLFDAIPPAAGGAALSTRGASADSAAADVAIDSTTVGAPADSGSADPPSDLAADAVGGWIGNRSFRPVVPRAAAAANPAGHRDRAVDRAAALLTSLPTEERLPALTEVQARVIRSVVQDEVRRDGAR